MFVSVKFCERLTVRESVNIKPHEIEQMTYRGNSLQRIPGDTEDSFTVSEIHYNQLHLHSRTFTGSHEFICYKSVPCNGFPL